MDNKSLGLHEHIFIAIALSKAKKLLININTMPMLKSRSSTPRAPLSLHEETKREKERGKKRDGAPAEMPHQKHEEKKKSNNFIYTRRISISITDSSFSSHIGRTLLKSNAHTKDTLLSLSCKANKQQHSTRKIRTQAASRGAASSPNLSPKAFRCGWGGREKKTQQNETKKAGQRSSS